MCHFQSLTSFDFNIVIWGKVPDRNKEMHDACYMKTFFAEVFVISMLVWIKNGARVWPGIKTHGKPVVCRF